MAIKLSSIPQSKGVYTKVPLTSEVGTELKNRDLRRRLIAVIKYELTLKMTTASVTDMNKPDSASTAPL